MGRLPNYRLRYRILLRTLDEIKLDRIPVSEVARENRASNNTVYNNIEAIRRDIDSIKKSKDIKKSRNMIGILN